MLDYPVVIDEHGDLSFFASLQSAELYLEAVDVENGEYVGYDASGRLLELCVRYERDVGHVVISPTADVRQGELQGKLVEFFSTVFPQVDFRGASLGALMDRARTLITQ